LASPARTSKIALQAIENNNPSAARKWLDRARDKIHVSGGDDPLAGQPFPYFWTKGQDADVPTMRTASLVLLRSKTVNRPYFNALDQARKAAKTDLDRDRLTMVMAYAYAAQEKWADMLPLTAELIKALPTSERAFELATMAYAGLKQFDDWERLVQTRIKEYPDELAYVRSYARLAAYRGQFGKSRDIIKGIIDKGQATENDLNLYAWYALFLPGPMEQSAIDVAQRANDLSKNANFPILHTLACVDAEAGKTSQARDLLLKAMDAVHMEEPNSEVWFGFALIAEQYGVLDAAEKMYSRVEKPKVDYPGTSYVIAQQHLTMLRTTRRRPLASSSGPPISRQAQATLTFHDDSSRRGWPAGQLSFMILSRSYRSPRNWSTAKIFQTRSCLPYRKRALSRTCLAMLSRKSSRDWPWGRSIPVLAVMRVAILSAVASRNPSSNVCRRCK
jgi:tetratricopeptide (TPR) repeat protein